MLPQRKHPAKGIIEDDRTPTLIFLTVCTAQRQPWLADPHVHERLIHIWRAATHWEVGPYILMPDHLHIFARPGFGSATFDRWIQILEINVHKDDL
jgi:putative transposase